MNRHRLKRCRWFCGLAFTALLLFCGTLFRMMFCNGEAENHSLCISNLRALDAAAENFIVSTGTTEGKRVETNELIRILGRWPKCPSGGEYTVPESGLNPVCSIHGLGREISVGGSDTFGVLGIVREENRVGYYAKIEAESPQTNPVSPQIDHSERGPMRGDERAIGGSPQESTIALPVTQTNNPIY